MSCIMIARAQVHMYTYSVCKIMHNYMPSSHSLYNTISVSIARSIDYDQAKWKAKFDTTWTSFGSERYSHCWCSAHLRYITIMTYGLSVKIRCDKDILNNRFPFLSWTVLAIAACIPLSTCKSGQIEGNSRKLCICTVVKNLYINTCKSWNSVMN